MAESNELKNLREQVGKILTSDACQKINFTLENVRVDGSDYYYVALALLNTTLGPSHVKFEIDSTIAAQAQYRIRANTFVFRTAGVAFDKGDGHQAIVHESTHAVIDAKSAKTKILRITNEMAAYIAGGLYNVFTSNNANDNFPIYREAHAIAETMNKQILLWNYSGAYAISASRVAALRSAILANTLYAALKNDPNATYGDDGLPL
jgi:hypothetical protein